MTAMQEYKNRHKEIKSKLNSLALGKTEKSGILVACAFIAKKLDVSGQTIYNYVQGRIKDGYLAEAIYKEFETYTPNN